MSMALHWPARKWEKAPLLCRWFGHVWNSGWWGDKPYLQPSNLPGYTDGIGARHVDLQCRCDRCGQMLTVAHVHNWQRADPPPTKTYEDGLRDAAEIAHQEGLRLWAQHENPLKGTSRNYWLEVASGAQGAKEAILKAIRGGT
jgi:hypothetical protein